MDRTYLQTSEQRVFARGDHFADNDCHWHGLLKSPQSISVCRNISCRCASGDHVGLPELMFVDHLCVKPSQKHRQIPTTGRGSLREVLSKYPLDLLDFLQHWSMCCLFSMHRGVHQFFSFVFQERHSAGCRFYILQMLCDYSLLADDFLQELVSVPPCGFSRDLRFALCFSGAGSPSLLMYTSLAHPRQPDFFLD